MCFFGLNNHCKVTLTINFSICDQLFFRKYRAQIDPKQKRYEELMILGYHVPIDIVLTLLLMCIRCALLRIY